MAQHPFEVVSVDHDEDLFAPRGWEGEVPSKQGIEWIVGQHRTTGLAVRAVVVTPRRVHWCPQAIGGLTRRRRCDRIYATEYRIWNVVSSMS